MQVQMLCRVVAKKIVSWLTFSFSWSPFFVRDLEQNFFPNLSQHLECGATAGLLSFLVRRWRAQYMDREHAEHVLKTRFYFNYFTCYSGIDTQGSQEFIPNFSFTCRQFNMVQISNDCMCVT